MKRYCFSLILILILVIFPSVRPGLTQTSDELKSLKKEMERLKEDQKAIQKDLQEIRNRLQSMGVLPEEPKNLFLNIAGKPFTGDRNAKLILIEFSEYQ